MQHTKLNCKVVVHAAAAAAVIMCIVLASSATACETDDHCQPSSCCHSNQCMDTTKAPAPNCTDIMCSAGCLHDTLDCGGECLCTVSKVCVPRIRAGMPPDGAGEWGVPRPHSPPSHSRVKRVVRKSIR